MALAAKKNSMERGGNIPYNHDYYKQRGAIGDIGDAKQGSAISICPENGVGGAIGEKSSRYSILVSRGMGDELECDAGSYTYHPTCQKGNERWNKNRCAEFLASSKETWTGVFYVS